MLLATVFDWLPNNTGKYTNYLIDKLGFLGGGVGIGILIDLLAHYILGKN